MRVGFNARLLSDPAIRGWNRYTVELLAELPAFGVELVLYADRPPADAHLARLPSGSYAVRVAPPMSGLAWEQRWLPRRAAADRVEVLHSPFNFGLPWARPCPMVLTLHDAIFERLEAGAAPFRERWSYAAVRSRLAHWIARTRADRVITVSEHSRSDLVEHLHLPADKVVVTYEAADARFHQPVAEAERARVRGALGLPGRYVFYIGGWDERKNLPFLVRALAAAPGDVALVLAGGRDEQRAGLVGLARGLGVAGRLHLLGWVDDADLPALYAEALAFAYPSRYEGFGLQLCEAMATGCPTLAARATCLPEVLGDGGETFGLDDPAELAALLRRLAAEPAFRADLARRALERARHFSWRRTAEQTLDVYRQALAGGGPAATISAARVTRP